MSQAAAALNPSTGEAVFGPSLVYRSSFRTVSKARETLSQKTKKKKFVLSHGNLPDWSFPFQVITVGYILFFACLHEGNVSLDLKESVPFWNSKSQQTYRLGHLSVSDSVLNVFVACFLVAFFPLICYVLKFPYPGEMSG